MSEVYNPIGHQVPRGFPGVFHATNLDSNHDFILHSISTTISFNKRCLWNFIWFSRRHHLEIRSQLTDMLFQLYLPITFCVMDSDQRAAHACLAQEIIWIFAPMDDYNPCAQTRFSFGKDDQTPMGTNITVHTRPALTRISE